MGFIREFTAADVPAVADLRLRAFPPVKPTSKVELERYYSETILGAPWVREGCRSMVYEEKGEIVGFLGVLPRDLKLNHTPIRAVVSTGLMVDPAHRGIIGVQLVKKLFDGEQDLTYSDVGNDRMRLLWERLGGRAALFHSMRWTRVLRPFRHTGASLGGELTGRLVRLAARPLFWTLDRMASSMAGSPFHQVAPRGTRAIVSTDDIVAGMHDVVRCALQPAYTTAHYSWLAARMSHHEEYGKLKQVGVWDEDGTFAGWYLYFVNPGGVSEVAQLAARPDRSGLVFSHLMHDAWRNGSIALSGRLQSGMSSDLVPTECRLERAAPWTLVHSKRADVLDAITRGDAYLTRFDGEWWMHFGT